MAQLFIRVTDGKYHSCDDGGEYETPAAALAFGVQSAVGIAAEEVAGGERSAAVEICVEDNAGVQVLRSVVAVSVSALTPAAHASRPAVLG